MTNVRVDLSIELESLYDHLTAAGFTESERLPSKQEFVKACWSSIDENGLSPGILGDLLKNRRENNESLSPEVTRRFRAAIRAFPSTAMDLKFAFLHFAGHLSE